MSIYRPILKDTFLLFIKPIPGILGLVIIVVLIRVIDLEEFEDIVYSYHNSI